MKPTLHELTANVSKHKLLLAELCGILLGDGSLSLRGDSASSINRLKITLNSVDDADYIIYVSRLLEHLFQVAPFVTYRKGERTADILLFRKTIIIFLTSVLGLCTSPKWNRAIIPEQFLSDPFDLKVVRGYFDTDGSLVTANNNGYLYPRLEMKICPAPMQHQFVTTLNSYGFRVVFMT